VVLATGTRSAIFFWDRQRLRQSPVMLKNIAMGVQVNTPTFNNCLLLVTKSELVFGRVRGVDKMQVRTIPLGLDNPRRIAYHPAANVFGVACLRVSPSRIGEADTSISTLYFLDGNTFRRIGHFSAGTDEELTAIMAIARIGEASQPNPPLNPCFVVGTVRYQLGEHEPSQGRILVFTRNLSGDPTSDVDESLVPAVALQTRGCVFALASVGDKILAAVNSSVVIYKMSKPNNSSNTLLEQVAEWNHNYFVTSLVSVGDIVKIGDAISSVSVLKIDGDTIRTIARDYGPLWPIAIESTNDGGVIGGNSDCNLFTFSLDDSQTSPTLYKNGNYYLGEVVTRFLRGGLGNTQDPHETGFFDPEVLFFTSTGRIGIVAHVNETIALHLTALQRNMGQYLDGPGETEHSKWRTPANARGRTDAESAFGFLDGDFLEQFLVFPDTEKLLEGENEAERITIEQHELQEIMEKLQSLH